MPARPSVEINDYHEHHKRLNILSEVAADLAEGILKKSGYTPPRGHYHPFMEFLTKLAKPCASGPTTWPNTCNMPKHYTSGNSRRPMRRI